MAINKKGVTGMRRIKISYEAIANWLRNGNIFINAIDKTKAFITTKSVDSDYFNPVRTKQWSIDVNNTDEQVTLFYTNIRDGELKFADEEITPEFIEFDPHAKLRLFLYWLSRDHLPLGTLEGIMLDVNRTFDCEPDWSEHWDNIGYSSGHLKNWADETELGR
jgi:hypothetical protein